MSVFLLSVTGYYALSRNEKKASNKGEIDKKERKKKAAHGSFLTQDIFVFGFSFISGQIK